MVHSCHTLRYSKCSHLACIGIVQHSLIWFAFSMSPPPILLLWLLASAPAYTNSCDMVPPVMIHLELAIPSGIDALVILDQQRLPAPCGAPLWWLCPQWCAPLLGPTFNVFQLIVSCGFHSSNSSFLDVQSGILFNVCDSC